MPGRRQVTKIEFDNNSNIKSKNTPILRECFYFVYNYKPNFVPPHRRMITIYLGRPLLDSSHPPSPRLRRVIANELFESRPSRETLLLRADKDLAVSPPILFPPVIGIKP